MRYSFNDHLHNYAVWTAARAVQRGFTNTKNIKEAIEQSKLPTIINNKRLKTSKGFDSFHRQCCRDIINHLKKKNKVKASYGQAAKIVAIYIKTAVVIRNSGKGVLSKIAHPPIDYMLLTNINREHKNLKLDGIKWTQLTEKKYFELINKLRTLKFTNFWELEKYWTPVQK
ncbi:hypothetical protein ACFLSV_07730 [Bacteroidota bacterium]